MNKEEKKYPIYKYRIKLMNQYGKKDSITNIIMFKEKKTDKELDEFLENIVKIKKGVIISKKITYIRDSNWCLGWFYHYTFNTHLSDEELTKSFMKYVDNKMDQGERDELMGADETHRHKPVCRCIHCIKKGIVRIDH